MAVASNVVAAKRTAKNSLRIKFTSFAVPASFWVRGSSRSVDDWGRLPKLWLASPRRQAPGERSPLQPTHNRGQPGAGGEHPGDSPGRDSSCRSSRQHSQRDGQDNDGERGCDASEAHRPNLPL